ncbi:MULTISPECIES: hypothetical protein [Streptosporangiaceae]|jgi:hypothetical protein|uniref:hypothetical protein n=1 Tax=Streptosporangiaceae TaxID=2004 RepID=UPI0034002C30
MADTNPTDDLRLKKYWTQPGQPGYIKIAWGTDGDWTRCQKLLSEHVGDSKARRMCARWHIEVNGFATGDRRNL